jgi:hypothetical protein
MDVNHHPWNSQSDHTLDSRKGNEVDLGILSGGKITVHLVGVEQMLVIQK